MAMSGNNLGTEIKAALDALSAGDRADMTKCLQAMGRAIVDHIQANAQTSTPNVQGGADTRTGTIT